jgi:hypothetical protein
VTDNDSPDVYYPNLHMLYVNVKNTSADFKERAITQRRAMSRGTRSWMHVIAQRLISDSDLIRSNISLNFSTRTNLHALTCRHMRLKLTPILPDVVHTPHWFAMHRFTILPAARTNGTLPPRRRTQETLCRQDFNYGSVVTGWRAWRLRQTPAR